MASNDPVADYLRSLNTSDRARAAAWDAVYTMEDAQAEQVLRSLPFSDEVKAALWDLRQGGTLSGTPQTPRPASTEQFMDPTAQPEGSAAGRFLRNAGEMLNPVTAAQGIYQAVRHPIQTGGAIIDAQLDQFGKAREAFERGGLGGYSEAIGHTAAGLIPLVGPAAAEAGEQIGSGDVAGGLGTMTGLLVPAGAPAAVRGTVRGARRVMGEQGRARMAGALEAGAAERVSDVMRPTVGPNKTRFGNMADDVAPQVAQDLARDGAPLTRQGLHTQVASRLDEAERALDAAADARLSARTFETQPIIDALLERRARLTAEAVQADRPLRAATGPPVRGARTPTEFVATGARTTDDIPAGQRGFRALDTGEFAEPRLSSVPVGENVVPGPNAARVAVIDQAIEELRRLGPVARYEPIRRIRQAYDGPAKAVYHPSMTADFLKAQGGKLGAADVTGVLRDTLGRWDPQTATANAAYSVYRAADDVMQATAELERVRPRVGRAIMARLTGALVGGQQAGVAGAAAGWVGGPLLDAAASAGFTVKLKTAATMQRLADAIRAGDVGRVEGLLSVLRRELKTTGAVQTGRLTEAAAATRTAESQEDTPPALGQR